MATEPQGNLGKPRFGPSDRLIAMFRACSRDPTEAIKTRLRRLLHTFLQHHGDNAGNEKTKELATKCCEAGIWYFRILEKGASQERKRLGISDISAILENDLFHCCLVACCLEITIFSTRLPCDFPLVLQIFKLAPYYFWKVIEPMVRAEAGLSRAVIRHLARVEEKVLESLAWTSDSPLWEEIRANEGHLPTYEQVMPLTQLEDPTRTDSQPDGNPPGVGPSLGAEQSASTDQQRSPSAVNRPRRSNSLHLFTRRVYGLMGKRLRELCSTLAISDELRLKIWTCFEHSLVHCTDLMVDRHLDQLLMCAIYIIAKITKVEIPFKRIMMCYKSQPLACKSVCKNVLISGRDAENDLTGNNTGLTNMRASPATMLENFLACRLDSFLRLPTGSTTNTFPLTEALQAAYLGSAISQVLLYADNGDHSDSLLTPNTPSTHYPGPCQEERGNLIYFYNQVYSTKIEQFAKQFAPTSGGDTPPLSPYPRQWKSSPRRHQMSSSIYISPHNTETTFPRTPGLCYYFNSSPPECLREINNMIKTGRSPNRRSYAVSLMRGEEEEEEDGPSAKRICLDGQSAWQRRLESMVNDRVTRRDQVTKPNLH